ncbi:MAG: shikimate dehydrogenase [Candidatus Nanopelagicales bacterium]
MTAGSRRAAVLGSPIAHSLSPALHRAAYAALGLDWTYDAVEVRESSLAEFVLSCGPEWAGLSLTMPLKTAVLPLLDVVSDVAAEVGAANTVVFGADGGRYGYNTDVPGMVSAIREAGVLEPVGPAVLLGGGATARSALSALARLGAPSVTAFLRRPSAGEDLVAVADRLEVGLAVRPWPEAEEALAAASARGALVVSTVPGGAADDLVSGDGLPAGDGVLLDVAYSPWPTGLAAAWAAAKGRVASGYDLLLWQAVDQVRLMTGQEPPVAAMRAALPA